MPLMKVIYSVNQPTNYKITCTFLIIAESINSAKINNVLHVTVTCEADSSIGQNFRVKKS